MTHACQNPASALRAQTHCADVDAPCGLTISALAQYLIIPLALHEFAVTELSRLIKAENSSSKAFAIDPQLPIGKKEGIKVLETPLGELLSKSERV